MSFGILNVTILKAKNVYDSDLFGNSDPYVSVELGKNEILKTFVANIDSSNSAIWDERLTFKIENADVLKNMRFTVLDKDKFGSDDVIFTVERSLTAEDFNVEEEKLELWELEEESKGSLQVVVHYIPMTLMEKMYEKLGNYAEAMKEKLISQIVTLVTSKV